MTLSIVTEPGYAVFSGPLVRRQDCVRALEASGFTVLPQETLPEDPSEHPPHRGLPSYRNPGEALEAGKPNSGHTPYTAHPESGEDYEPDPRIAFVDVRLPETDGALDEIHRVAQGARFTLRLHTASPIRSRRRVEEALSVEERLQIAEAQLAAIRMDRLRASGVPMAAITSPPYALQQSSHGAQLFREAIGSLIAPAGGIVQPSDFTVTQNGTPNMSVNVGAGRIWVPSTYTATVNPGGGAYYPGGLYYAENDATVNLAISAANPTNPRLDQGIVQVQDAAYSGSTNSAQLAILTGTPTSGAALNNLVGLASMPASSLLLAYELVPANATSIVTADIANQAGVVRAIGVSSGQVYGGAAQTANNTHTAITGLSIATPPIASGGVLLVWFSPSIGTLGAGNVVSARLTLDGTETGTTISTSDNSGLPSLMTAQRFTGLTGIHTLAGNVWATSAGGGTQTGGSQILYQIVSS